MISAILENFTTIYKGSGKTFSKLRLHSQKVMSLTLITQHAPDFGQQLTGMVRLADKPRRTI